MYLFYTNFWIHINCKPIARNDNFIFLFISFIIVLFVFLYLWIQAYLVVVIHIGHYWLIWILSLRCHLVYFISLFYLYLFNLYRGDTILQSNKSYTAEERCCLFKSLSIETLLIIIKNYKFIIEISKNFLHVVFKFYLIQKQKKDVKNLPISQIGVLFLIESYEFL